MTRMTKVFSETFVAAALVALLLCFINPFGWWMPDMLHMTLLGLIVALFAVFAMFLWREKVTDERERLHRFIAARFGYIVAGDLLLAGTVVQAFAHDIDPWLPATLAAMVLAKIVGRSYAERSF